MKTQPDKKVVYFPYTPGVSTTEIKKTIIECTNQIVQAAFRITSYNVCYTKLLRARIQIAFYPSS